MSFHGGVIGTSLGILWMARKHKLDWLRIHDYVACCVPFGLFFGRLANFVNGELWGRETTLPWAIRFIETIDGAKVIGPPRHPSQLYEAGLEGIVLFLVLWFLFWKTDARYQPGKLVGAFLLVYGLSRFTVELVRQPDLGLEHLPWGLTMGQTLTVPMVLGGAWLIATAKGRRQRVEPIAGTESVA
jgi:phosphatidylglycerol:prolipoprotein diacylglycerol transferase